MDEPSWTEQAISNFFATRETPTRAECDAHALKITGASASASAVQQVAVPGSLSYTVHCSNTIISFRESASALDPDVLNLAKSIHGDLVPHAVFDGKMPDSNPKLLVYTMPCLPGVPCVEVFGCKDEMSIEEEAIFLFC